MYIDIRYIIYTHIYIHTSYNCNSAQTYCNMNFGPYRPALTVTFKSYQYFLYMEQY